MTKSSDPKQDDLPRIGAPATRALATIGIARLSQLNGVSEANLAQLHGVGPKAIRILREALAKAGWSFGDKDAGAYQTRHL